VVVAVLHAPAPSQVRALVWVDAPGGQLAAAQTVPAAYFWQAPAPLQTPFVPHEAAPWSLQVPAGSDAPAATFVQVPAVLVEALHDWQVPLQLVAQQTPCVQSLDLHSSALEQVRPLSLRPHDPFVQTAGGLQSAFALQAFLQAEEPHMYGEHEDEAGVTQVPAPSQVDDPVKVTVLLGQVALLHVVPLAYF
jgi:hypothetical protein